MCSPGPFFVYLEDLMPAKKTEFVAIRVTPQEQVRLKTAALVRDITVTDLVREAIVEWLDRHGILEPGERRVP